MNGQFILDIAKELNRNSDTIRKKIIQLELRQKFNEKEIACIVKSHYYVLCEICFEVFERFNYGPQIHLRCCHKNTCIRLHGIISRKEKLKEKIIIQNIRSNLYQKIYLALLNKKIKKPIWILKKQALNISGLSKPRIDWLRKKRLIKTKPGKIHKKINGFFYIKQEMQIIGILNSLH